jgi:basic membrane protein A
MRKRLLLLLSILLSFSLLAAACGDDDGDSDDAADDGTDAGDDGEGDMDDEGEGDPGDTGADDFCLPLAAADETTASADFSVGMTYDLLGRGDQSFNDSAACGLDRAANEIGISFTEITPVDESARATDLQRQAENSPLVVGVGFSFRDGAIEAAGANPDTNFAIVDDAMLDFDTGEPVADNVAGLVFAEEQGSYLVGAAAALKSETGTIGFLGGVSGIGLIEKFEAGFIAGAKSINPDIEVLSEYITAFPDFAGFESPDQGREIAASMYDDGADIVYAAAGLSGSGMFQAAADYSSENDSKVWGIGVDSDQYLTVDPANQEYVLTSMLKRVDVAVFDIIEAQANGEFSAGAVTYDLAADGVGYSTSGGFVDDIVDQLEEIKAEIVSGAVVVPTDPADA